MGRMSAYTGKPVTWEQAELEAGHVPGEPDVGHEPAGAAGAVRRQDAADLGAAYSCTARTTTE